MHNFAVEIISGNYMFRLQSSHHQAVYNKRIKGNYVIYNYIISFYISCIYSLIMVNLYPKHVAVIYNCYKVAY